MISNSTFNIIDTHCHLNFNDFDRDRVQVVERAREIGITKLIDPGIDLETSKTALHCSSEFPEVFSAVGIHPNSGLGWTQNTITQLKELAGDEKVVAIGEIGLDYYRDHASRELQRAIFLKQLELAAELGLPVIIHNREASDDILDFLQNWHRALMDSGSKLAGSPGVMHSFSSSVEFAQAMVSINFKIGITGAVTFRNSQILQSVVSALPLESLLIETDAPYQTPHPFRGKRNEPANVRIIAEKIAELKAYPVDKVARTTTEEADKLFNWRVIH